MFLICGIAIMGWNASHASPASMPHGEDSIYIRLEPMKSSEVEFNPIWIRFCIVNGMDIHVRVRNLPQVLGDDILRLESQSSGRVSLEPRLITLDDPTIGPRDSLVIFLALDHFGRSAGSSVRRYLPADEYRISLPVYSMIGNTVSFVPTLVTHRMTITPLNPEHWHLQHSVALIESDTSSAERWKLIMTMIQQNPSSQLIPRLLKSLHVCAVADQDSTRFPLIAHAFQKMIQRYPDDPACIDMLRWITDVNEYGHASEVTATYIPFLRIIAKKHRTRLVGTYARHVLERITPARPVVPSIEPSGTGYSSDDR